MSSPPALLPHRVPAKLPYELDQGQWCWLVYRTPGTSAEFSVRGMLRGIERRGQVEYVCLAGGCELRLDWLVAVNGHRLAS